MQTELRLFQIPNIDTSILSGIGEFRDRIERFESHWNIKLEFSPNARWRPGSYERLKGQVVKSLFPHWSKPKGANTIRRLTKHCNYTVGNLQKELIGIDDELRTFRNNKIYLEGGKAAEEGRELLDELMGNYSKKVSDVYVDITSVPYWNRNRRTSLTRTITEPIVPKIITSDGVLPSPMEGFALTTITVKERLDQASKSKNPKRWWINIIVNLHDIALLYFKNSSETRALANIPWGNLYVGFSIPLYDLVMNFRRIKNNVNLRTSPIDTTRFANHTYKFPTIPGLQHPFVNRAPNNQTNSYEWGNTCFGSWREEVTTALCTGNIAHLKAILVLWSETYHCNNTSPLNQPETTHLEWHIDWPKDINNYLRTSPTTCRTTVQQGFDTSDLIDNHCIVCVLREMGDCSYFEELTYVPYDMPREFLDILAKKLIDNGGNPASEYIVIKRLAQKMWSMKTRITDAQFNSWFYIQDSGTGFMNYDEFLHELSLFNECKLSHYTKQPVDWEKVVERMISLYNYAERVYWTNLIRHYNEDAWNRLADTFYFDWTEDADERLPIDEIASMIHIYRLQVGNAGSEPIYSAYMMDIYQLKLAAENVAESFDEAIDELNESSINSEIVLERVNDNEESEGPF